MWTFSETRTLYAGTFTTCALRYCDRIVIGGPVTGTSLISLTPRPLDTRYRDVWYRQAKRENQENQPRQTNTDKAEAKLIL